MDGKDIYIKTIVIAAIAWIGDKLDIYMPLVCLLTFMMFLDYISGMLASKKEAMEHPNSKKYGWSSKKGILGIYKKIGYIMTIVVAICIDCIICKFNDELGGNYNIHTFFGLLVTIWFITNESISILENVGRMGVELPSFLKRILVELKKDVENKDL